MMKKLFIISFTVFVLLICVTLGVNAYQHSQETWEVYTEKEAAKFLSGNSNSIEFLQVKYSKEGKPFFFFEREGKVQVAHPDHTRTIWSYMTFLEETKNPSSDRLNTYWKMNWASDTSIQLVEWK